MRKIWKNPKHPGIFFRIYILFYSKTYYRIYNTRISGKFIWSSWLKHLQFFLGSSLREKWNCRSCAIQSGTASCCHCSLRPPFGSWPLIISYLSEYDRRQMTLVTVTGWWLLANSFFPLLPTSGGPFFLLLIPLECSASGGLGCN